MNKKSSQLTSQEKELQYRGIFEAAKDGLIISDLETSVVVEANAAACQMHGYPVGKFIGLRLSAFVHPEDQKKFSQQLQALQINGGIDTRTRQLRLDGQAFSAEWRGTVFNYQDRPCLLSIVRDVSKRVGAEQELRQREETYSHEQATLLEISHTLASTLDFQPGLILEQLGEMVEYDRGALFALEGATLVSLAARGTPGLKESPPLRIRLQTSETMPGMVVGHQPARIGNIGSTDPLALSVQSVLGDEASGLLEKMHSFMWVPLVVKSRMIGSFALAHAEQNHFTAHNADLALSVANQAAITMTNAELNEKAQALAVVEERQRLARNLHDAVNQSLFSAGLIAEVLPRLWDRDQQEARRSLEDLRRLTQGAMAEMRALLAELRPSTLTDADLGDLLHQLGKAFTGRTNVPAKVTMLGTRVLPAEVQVAIYRVCQEALNNIAKHAGSSMVEISLKHEGTSSVLSIRDDGRGFNPDQTSSGHYGLSMMRERASAVGAELSIASQPGHGTELTVHWTKTPAGKD
jgi:PAS domain S-box-containing protein